MEKQKSIILCIDDEGAGLEARKELLEISGNRSERRARPGIVCFPSD